MSLALFGPSGVRGVINKDLTPEVALQLGRAVGRTFDGTVAVATDARDSARAVASGVMSGLMSMGKDVVYLGLLPTPAFQYYVRTHDEITGGVMVTASHNPEQYNGLKMIMQDGVEATEEDEAALESFFNHDIRPVSSSDVGTMRCEEGAIDDYLDAIISYVDAESIRNAKLTVCVDCASGATSLTTPALLRRLNVKAVTMGCDPTGTPTRESDPRLENLWELMALTNVVHPDLSVAHDSDGSRAIFICGDGTFLNGDESGALMAKYILTEKKGKVVSPVSSSHVLRDVVETNGGLMKYTEVSSHMVIRKMIENMAVFGVEENGGMVFPEFQMCKDGGLALAKVLEMVAKCGALENMVAELPRYHLVKRRVDCPDNMKRVILDQFVKDISDGYHYDTTDGIKATSNDGWILLRPSTTEACFRIYSESTDAGTSESRADQAEERIYMILSKKN